MSKRIVYLLSFFCFVLYNYNGDNMNKDDIVVSIKSNKDIDKINVDTKYINICIDNIDIGVIDYFLLNGVDYSFTDTIGNKSGFVYASYDMFKYSESVITNIIDNMPCNLNNIEKIRYIYIALGKILCVDINAIEEKNDDICFSNISYVNNIWSSLYRHSVNDISISKIFLYLCSRLGFKCELIYSSINGNVANKIYVDNDFMIVDLYNDIHNIQGSFVTMYFDKYNDDKDMDIKIGYIKEEYMDYYVDDILKNIDSDNYKNLYEILVKTGNKLELNRIGSYEMFKIYKKMFEKYVPNYDFKISNLFICNRKEKEHFTLFSSGENYYGFNYNKCCFVNINLDIIFDNIKNNKIGIYNNENFCLDEKRMVL